MSTVLFKEKNLSVFEAGISAKVKAAGGRCPFTQEAEPQYPKMMAYIRDHSLRCNVVNYKTEIWPKRMPVSGNEHIWDVTQHREKLIDETRVLTLKGKFRADAGQKQIPLFMKHPDGHVVPFCGVRRDEAVNQLLNEGESCVDDFCAILVYPQYEDGTPVPEKDWLVHLAWLAGFSNSDQEDVKDPLSFDEKANTLASVVKAEDLDYSEPDHVERMHEILKELHPKDFSGNECHVKGLRTRCIQKAADRITTKLSDELISSAAQIYAKFCPDEVWTPNRKKSRNVHMELGTMGTRYWWSMIDPGKEDSILHDCQAKDVELYMREHKKMTELTYDKHIKSEVAEFTKWNQRNCAHLTCNMIITRIFVPKSNLADWDKDRAWVWKPNHKDGAKFVEIFEASDHTSPLDRLPRTHETHNPMGFYKEMMMETINRHAVRAVVYTVDDMLPWIERDYPETVKHKRGGIKQIKAEIISNFFHKTTYRDILTYEVDKENRTVTFF